MAALRFGFQRRVCPCCEFHERGFILPKKLCLAAFVLVLAVSGIALGQTLQKLTNQPPDGAGIGFFLTDGTVIVQGNGESDWAKLTPDKFGSYVHGTWKTIASLPAGYVPDAFASAVLADGRVIIEGGEYNNNQFAFTNLGAVYDPVKDTWTKQKPPARVGLYWRFAVGRPAQWQISVGQQVRQAHRRTRSHDADLDRTQCYRQERPQRRRRLDAHARRISPDLRRNQSPALRKIHRVANRNGSAPEARSSIYTPPLTSTAASPTASTVAIIRPGRLGRGSCGRMGQCLLLVRIRMAVAGRDTLRSIIRRTTSGPWALTFLTGTTLATPSRCLLPNGNVLVEGDSGTLYDFDGTHLTPDAAGKLVPS